ncbi:MAG: M15 family metallopeptidase [Oscillospiraceae bacterium]
MKNNVSSDGNKRRRIKKRKAMLRMLVSFVIFILIIVGIAMLLINVFSSKAAEKPNSGTDTSQTTGDKPEIPTVLPSEPIVPEEPKVDPDNIFTPYERGGAYFVKIDGLEMLLVNKDYHLSETYGDEYGSGLAPEAQEAFDSMQSAANADGLSLWVQSGHRSYDTQQGLFNGYAQSEGEQAASRYSARPGQSEHQTGLAMDINQISSSFENTSEFEWLSENAADYGFILRFMKGKEAATGYMYEPWHYRYVGVQLAHILKDSGLSVEEYIGLCDTIPA